MDRDFDELQNKVLYEDNHLLIINKKPGDIVQGDISGDEPLRDKFQRYLKKKYDKPGNVFLGVVHRLDRPTSGVVIFAKTSKALSKINMMLQRREINKTYWAVTEKKLPLDAGKLEHYLFRNRRQNKSFVCAPEVTGAQRAELDYHFLEKSDRYYLYEVDLITGRHHQIRCQLSAEGCVIKGDLKYGAVKGNVVAAIHLHARRIAFTHPITKKEIVVEATPPQADVLWRYFHEQMEMRK